MKTFYIKQRIFTITDRYFVYDQYQQPTYEVNGKFFTIGDELTLTNLKGDELFRIKQRIMSLFGAYDVYKQNKLCATIKRRATLFRPKLDIESDDGNFEIEGDFWDYNFSILKDGHTIGTIEKEWLTLRDSYKLTVNDSELETLFISMVIAIDNCLHNEKKNN
ncbi:MAG: LURP-one-related family protein [Turicibacter sp.]|nr:LURP-one-related family protein [Turicibacter sp.]